MSRIVAFARWLTSPGRFCLLRRSSREPISAALSLVTMRVTKSRSEPRAAVRFPRAWELPVPWADTGSDGSRSDMASDEMMEA